MMRASMTPGMAHTRFNNSSVSMVAPTILCGRSEGRGAPVRAGLGVPHLPRGPPGTAGSREDPDLIVDNLDPEDLMTTGHGLARREPEDLPGRSPNVDPVLVPESRSHSLHRDYPLFP